LAFVEDRLALASNSAELALGSNSAESASGFAGSEASESEFAEAVWAWASTAEAGYKEVGTEEVAAEADTAGVYPEARATCNNRSSIPTTTRRHLESKPIDNIGCSIVRPRQRVV
jgi:hypothetical protein